MVDGTVAVELSGASVRTGNRTVWSNLDLRIESGEFVAVLGPNGVGKSTLIKVILGLVPISAGTVTVMGATPLSARRNIGYLPQRRSFDPSLRVRGIDIVTLGFDGHRFGLPIPFATLLSANARRRAQAVEEALHLVGASSYARRPIGQLSGGEQQRLLIAQALVRRPKMLLLDEPLDSLDIPNQAATAALVSDICRQSGITVMLVAHDVNPILAYLDRVVYVGQGGAVSGPPEEVMTAETLSRLYDTPIDVFRTSQGRLCVVGQPDIVTHGHGHHQGEDGPNVHR